jgi:hypothetical protein
MVRYCAAAGALARSTSAAAVDAFFPGYRAQTAFDDDIKASKMESRGGLGPLAARPNAPLANS